MADDYITAFISYAHEDSKLARAIQERLEAAGFTVWIDEGALRAGDSLIQSIATAIHEMTIGVVKEGVGEPRNDMTRGSALYKVPLRLSRTPSPEWDRLFVQCWDHPPSFSTMHRPGIARVNDNTIVLDGTTMDELEKYHARTLRLCVQHSPDPMHEGAIQGGVRDLVGYAGWSMPEPCHARTWRCIKPRRTFQSFFGGAPWRRTPVFRPLLESNLRHAAAVSYTDARPAPVSHNDLRTLGERAITRASLGHRFGTIPVAA